MSTRPYVFTLRVEALRGGQVKVVDSFTNLDQLPPTGAVIIAAPLKLVAGSGSPRRVIALVPAE